MVNYLVKQFPILTTTVEVDLQRLLGREVSTYYIFLIQNITYF